MPLTLVAVRREPSGVVLKTYEKPGGLRPMPLTLENFMIKLMLDVAEFARIQKGSAIL